MRADIQTTWRAAALLDGIHYCLPQPRNYGEHRSNEGEFAELLSAVESDIATHGPSQAHRQLLLHIASQ